MANDESTSQSPIFLERLQGIFSRDEDAADDAENPTQKGAVIFTCIFLSFLMWFMFTLQETYTTEIEMPTRVTNIAPDQALVERPPSSARVRVQGEGYNLLRLKMNPSTLPIDARSGDVDLQGLVDLPTGVDLLSIMPQQIEVRTEDRVRRDVPVQFRGDISTPPTHALVGDVELVPDTIIVTGGRSILQGLTSWPTDSLRLENVRDTVTAEVALADTLSGLVTRSANQVRVQVVAERFTEGMRTVDVRIPGGPEGAVTLEPSTIEVRYRVPVDQYRRSQEAEGFFAEVPYDEIRADTTGAVTPELNLPDDIDIRSVEMIPNRLRYYHVIREEE